MNCGCCKDLGCFAPGEIIDFGISALTAVEPYIFHIWTIGGYMTDSATLDPGDPLQLPFTFNENAETTIKIQFPSDLIDTLHGINFVTTADGACCFTVHGMIPTCS
jgi:hypothetical protein